MCVDGNLDEGDMTGDGTGGWVNRTTVTMAVTVRMTVTVANLYRSSVREFVLCYAYEDEDEDADVEVNADKDEDVDVNTDVEV